MKQQEVADLQIYICRNNGYVTKPIVDCDYFSNRLLSRNVFEKKYRVAFRLAPIQFTLTLNKIISDTMKSDRSNVALKINAVIPTA